jgi:hypothetical protein
MKDSTVILLVVGGFVLLFWAFSKGFLTASPTGLAINPQTGQPYGAIQVPQPATNYSGFLAATTAPGVGQALNTIIGGLGTGLSAWISGGAAPNVPTPGQSASVNSPALAAQPTGALYGPFVDATTFQGTATPVGPIVDPTASYNSTSGLAFDYSGLSSANSFDPTYSLLDPALGGSGVVGA